MAFTPAGMFYLSNEDLAPSMDMMGGGIRGMLGVQNEEEAILELSKNYDVTDLNERESFFEAVRQINPEIEKTLRKESQEYDKTILEMDKTRSEMAYSNELIAASRTGQSKTLQDIKASKATQIRNDEEHDNTKKTFNQLQDKIKAIQELNQTADFKTDEGKNKYYNSLFKIDSVAAESWRNSNQTHTNATQELLKINDQRDVLQQQLETYKYDLDTKKKEAERKEIERANKNLLFNVLNQKEPELWKKGLTQVMGEGDYSKINTEAEASGYILGLTGKNQTSKLNAVKAFVTGKLAAFKTKHEFNPNFIEEFGGEYDLNETFNVKDKAELGTNSTTTTTTKVATEPEGFNPKTTPRGPDFRAVVDGHEGTWTYVNYWVGNQGGYEVAEWQFVPDMGEEYKGMTEEEAINYQR